MSNNRTIAVTGKGSIHVIPDVTRLEAIIESVFKTYDDAYQQAKENSKWMVQILEYNHKSGKLAKTIRLDITDHTISEYDDDDHYIGQIKDGFDLNQRFKIDLGMDTVLLNKIIRGIGKYIPGAQISIGYTVQDPRPSQLKMQLKKQQSWLKQLAVNWGLYLIYIMALRRFMFIQKHVTFILTLRQWPVIVVV